MILHQMEYYAVHIQIAYTDDRKQTCRELLADAAAESGFESFEDTEEGLTGYVQTNLFDASMLDQTIADTCQLLDSPTDDQPSDLDPTANEAQKMVTYTVSPTESIDWNETWEQQGFEPIIIDSRCLIYDARQQGENPLCAHLAPLRIGIEAKMAFGTGTHETTRMVVAALLDLPLEGRRVLDCGCGTGILSIVASKCGASEVVAYDIDEWSVENTRHNAALNQAANISTLLGDSRVLSHVSGMFDVIVANINRNILLDDMKHFEEVLNTNGTIIISGFYEEDSPLLIAEAAKHDLHLTSTKSNNHWACLILTR